LTGLDGLWAEHRARLRGYVAQRVRDDTAVDDILQDVYLKAHSALSAVRSSGSLTAWLFRIAANTIADHYRARRPWEAIPEDPPAPEPARDEAAELAECIRPLVAGLPEIYRTALTLSDPEGLPQKEVAERLGVSLSGAKSRVQRGRARLRQNLLDCCTIEIGRRGIVGYAPHDPQGGHGCGEDCG
jgi:RNA polymerase sigma-70 factor (ECF subfamily)